MLDSDVDAFLDVAVTDLSVEDDADCGFCDVVDDACLAVVDFVWLSRKVLVSIGTSRKLTIVLR